MYPKLLMVNPPRVEQQKKSLTILNGDCMITIVAHLVTVFVECVENLEQEKKMENVQLIRIVQCLCGATEEAGEINSVHVMENANLVLKLVVI